MHLRVDVFLVRKRKVARMLSRCNRALKKYYVAIGVLFERVKEKEEAITVKFGKDFERVFLLFVLLDSIMIYIFIARDM